MNDYSKKLTITLTLKGRDEFTYRWMDYMNNIACPYKILIADGGDNKFLEEHLQNYSNYPLIHYEYIRYPFDETTSLFFKKLESLISKVTTEYILQADNDDFFLLDRIPELIDFLENNHDYISARGQLVNFEVFNKEGISKAQVHGSRYEASAIFSESIDSECPFQRVEKLCLGMAKFDYYSNWYSITKTKALKKVWKNLITLPNKEVIILEILAHIFLSIKGKIKIINKPFYLRQSNTSVFGDTLVINNKFLEDCIINNSFENFSIAINKFSNLANSVDKQKLLKSIAGWLNIFLFNISLSHKLRSNFLYILISKTKRWYFFSFFIQSSIYFFKNIILHKQGRYSLRLKEIEAFILK